VAGVGLLLGEVDVAEAAGADELAQDEVAEHALAEPAALHRACASVGDQCLLPKAGSDRESVLPLADLNKILPP
jgi:hypothetical protein